MRVSEEITAVIVSYNSTDVLAGCIQSLKDAGLTHIVVVDNASSDQSVEVARSFNAVVIASDENQGYPRATNMGIRQVTTPFGFALNPDCRVSAECLQHLLDAANLYPEASVLAPLLSDSDGRVFIRGSSILCPYLAASQRAAVNPEGNACFPIVSGAALLFRMADFQNDDIYDANLFLYHDEDDMCLRVYRRGKCCILVPAAKAVHDANTSSPMSSHLQFWKGWHRGWSERYMRHKHGLADVGLKQIIRMGLFTGYSFIKNGWYFGMYACGIFAGWVDYTRGKTAQQMRIPAK